MKGETRKTLYILDGHSQFYRAYHAIRSPMKSPATGEPTNATFGFVGMFLRLLRERKPDYLVVTIDVSDDTETFRSEIYPEYKANRPPAPEDFHPQVERCVAMLEAMGAPVVGAPGFEADDAIATLVDMARRERPDIDIHIITKDKDLQQLLESDVVVLDDVQSGAVVTEESLKRDKGVAPAQIIDMLALMGDSVDNVPGVEGIGPKTAAQLLAKYDNLDNLLANAAEIKGKRGESLRAAGETLALSRTLVTLRHDAPVQLDLEAADVTTFDMGALVPIFQELGFTRFGQEAIALAKSGDRNLGASGDTGSLFTQSTQAPAGALTRATKAGDYRCIRTASELKTLVEQMADADMVAIDTETTGLSPLSDALVGISVAIEEGAAAYVPLRSPEPGSHLAPDEALAMLKPSLEDDAIPKCGHNLKFDLLVLRKAGVALRGVAHDSLIASVLIDPERPSHSLDNLALALLKHQCTPISALLGAGKTQRTFDTAPLDLAAPYAAEDADIALRLRNLLAPQLRAMQLESLCADVETPLVEVLAELEWNGVAVDADELDRQAVQLKAKLDDIKAQIVGAAPRPFNPDSPKQLAGILFNKPDDPDAPGLGLKPRKRNKTGPSTDVEVLEALAADPSVDTTVPALVVEHRQLAKLISTYLVALKNAINCDSGRIHASFHQMVAATGRLSSSNPNLQNIPIRTAIGREIRKAFRAPPGKLLVGADYSQIELRMLAHLSRDPALIGAFEAGEDIHRAVAAQIHSVAPEAVTSEQRSGAKMVNFGIIYGVTPFGLSRRLGVTNSEAADIIDAYKARFTGITTFLRECVDKAKRLGYVETILGRRRPITGVESRNPAQRAMAERVAINSVVQGSAADLIKLAMLDLHAHLSPYAAHWRRASGMADEPAIADVRMILQIHDELLFEAPEDRAEATRALVVERMEGAMDLRAPLVVDSAIGRSWWDTK